jgi:glutathione synthase/RimK-type ligase-like ATP-grasp enzyme
VFVDQADVLGHDVHVSVDGGLCAWIERPQGPLDLNDVSAAYIRPHNSAQAPQVALHGPDSAETRHAWHVDERLLTWADVTSAFIVNRPSAMASNDSKPHQSLDALAVGFEVPATLLTTDPAAVRRFAAIHGGVIYKSISGVRSIVTLLAGADMDRLDDVTWCPTQFQAYVAGTDVRVHVLGDSVFACEIASDACDYRYGGYSIGPCHLPSEVSARCVVLARRLGLELAGIDLRRTPDDRWYCFEANPSPAFTCFGDEIELEVADALAECLIAGTASSAVRPAVGATAP